jgi:proteasome accessory factor A
VRRAGEFSSISDTLLPFLISRQIICGAGKLVATSKGATYAVSQRADHIWEGVSSATTRSRPIINTRDEPHADAEQYRRLHVIVGDSNMSETTTMLKVGSADLVLRMIEAGVVRVTSPWRTRSGRSARSPTTAPGGGRSAWPTAAR